MVIMGDDEANKVIFKAKDTKADEINKKKQKKKKQKKQTKLNNNKTPQNTAEYKKNKCLIRKGESISMI